MKTYIQLFLFLCLQAFGIFSFAGCSGEKELVPSGYDSPSRFDFPEGSNSWDTTFENFYKEYNTQIIYKSWQISDLERSWLSGTGMNVTYRGSYYSDEKLQQIATFLQSLVFDNLPKNWAPKDRIFPMYLYLIDNFYVTPNPREYWATIDGKLGYYLDCWMISPADSTLSLQNAHATRSFCGRIIRDYIEQGYNRGRIAAPDGFDDGIDWSVPIVYLDSQIENPNYYLARGLVDYVYPMFTSQNAPKATSESSMYGWQGYEDLFAYVGSIMFLPDFTEVYAEWPEIIRRYNMVVDHFKSAYDIDLVKISRAINLIE